MSDRIAVMHDGVVEQLADPRTLYERPTTAFVAGFIGTSNLLVLDRPSTVESLLVVSLGDGQRITSRIESPAPSASELQITVRPERISLHVDTDAAVPENHSQGPRAAPSTSSTAARRRTSASSSPRASGSSCTS